jgi:hypothetical protein
MRLADGHPAEYIKDVNKKLKEKGDEEAIKEFQAGAGAAMKKLIANYDNYDVMMGSSMNPEGMYVFQHMSPQVTHR